MPAAYDSPDFALLSDGVRTLFAGVTMTATRGLLITMGQVSYIKVPSVESDKNRHHRNDYCVFTSWEQIWRDQFDGNDFLFICHKFW